MNRSFLDCRLLHLDYDMDLIGDEKREKEIESKNRLLAEFISSFGLTNAIVRNSVIASDKEKWYFTVTHARGTTMVYFSKWPAGIDCIANQDVPANWKEIAISHFTHSELDWLEKNNTSDNFAKLWTCKEAFFKCYHNTYSKDVDFNEWTFVSQNNELSFTNNKETFACHQGTSEPTYTFFICEQE